MRHQKSDGSEEYQCMVQRSIDGEEITFWKVADRGKTSHWRTVSQREQSLRKHLLKLFAKEIRDERAQPVSERKFVSLEARIAALTAKKTEVPTL